MWFCIFFVDNCNSSRHYAWCGVLTRRRGGHAAFHLFCVRASWELLDTPVKQLTDKVSFCIFQWISIYNICILCMYMMYAAAIVNLFIFRCPVRPVRYSSFTIFWIWGVLFVSCTSVVPFLFGNAGKVASMTLVKGSRSRGTMTSFLCATLAALFGWVRARLWRDLSSRHVYALTWLYIMYRVDNAHRCLSCRHRDL